jgi:hypothetical protein
MNEYLKLAIAESLNSGHPDNASEGTLASVTQLISPVQQIVLARRHPAEKDPETCLKLFIGTAIHEHISRSIQAIHTAHMAGAISEQRIVGEFGGEKIGGGIDLQIELPADKWKVIDFKSTSVFTVQRMSRIDEWTEQLNIYAALMAQRGREVSELAIVTILADWSNAVLGKELRDHPQSKYPRTDSVEIPIELWSAKKRTVFIEGRIAALKAALQMPDEKLPRCEDTWGGRRCQQYCDCSAWCCQYKERKDF